MYSMKGVDSKMTDAEIYDLAYTYKSAMLAAHSSGDFDDDDVFCDFPTGCCGDTCVLLAAYLELFDVHTIYIWGDRGRQSHAWLVVNDSRVKQPTPSSFNPTAEYKQWMKLYGQEVTGPIDTTRYTARDFTNGLIIDITADQFGESSVYVGPRNSFYRRFTFHSAHTCNGAHEYRLNKLYRKIAEFLP